MARLPKYDVVSIEDLGIAEIERIFTLADGFSAALENAERLTVADGLIMATLFYEPSTRTRLSFESAMHRLGGAVISSADMHASSAAKGESLADTVRVVSGYADLIVIRHPHDGAAHVAAEYAPCPIINAGDGSREHPTQTLCDLYILRKKKGHLRGLTVALCGDLKYGRTVHSLIYALARFGANILAVPTAGMDVPEYVLERVRAESQYRFATVSMDELKSLAGGLDALYLTPRGPHQMALFTSDMPLEKIPAGQAPKALDAFYVTRLQKERLQNKSADAGEYVRFDARALKGSRTHDAVVMHPLPRTTELAYELDADPRAVYFEQAAAGVPGAHGAHRVDARERRDHRSCDSQGVAADALQVGERAAMQQRQLHHPLRGRLPEAALSPRARQHRFGVAAAMRFLRARVAGRICRPRQHPSLLSLRRRPRRLCQELDRRRLARGFRQRQAGRRGRLRALQARPAARDHECR